MEVIAQLTRMNQQFHEVWEIFEITIFNSGLFLALQNYWYASRCSTTWSSDWRISPICRFGTYGERRPQKTSENPQAISAKSIGKCQKMPESSQIFTRKTSLRFECLFGLRKKRISWKLDLGNFGWPAKRRLIQLGQDLHGLSKDFICKYSAISI